MGRRRPSRPSSAAAATRATRSTGAWRDTARTARAIARSNPDPSLRSCAGARLTVRRVPGKRYSADVMPLRTRWRASWTARSASPTTTKLGTPSTRCASTSTRRAVIPMSQKRERPRNHTDRAYASNATGVSRAVTIPARMRLRRPPGCAVMRRPSTAITSNRSRSASGCAASSISPASASRRCLRASTASAGAPRLRVRRAFTSHTTSVVPRRATTSTSRPATRTFRPTIR